MKSERRAVQHPTLRDCYGQLFSQFPSRELVDSSRLAVAVTDEQGRVALATDGAPLANVEELVRTCLDFFDALQPGDAVITNDPYSGGSRVQDHFMLAPVHEDAAGLVGFAVVCAPFVDVGGMTLGNDLPDAGDIWTEGVRTKPVRVRRATRVDEDIIRLLGLNSRVPVLVSADVAVMCDVADRLVREVATELAKGLAERVIADELRDLKAQLDSASADTERESREVDGAEGEDPLARIELALTVDDSSIRVDLAGSSAQLDASHINSTRHNTTTAIADAVRGVTGCALTSAITECLDLRFPERSVVDCALPVPVGGSVDQTCTHVLDATTDCLRRALGQAGVREGEETRP